MKRRDKSLKDIVYEHICAQENFIIPETDIVKEVIEDLVKQNKFEKVSMTEIRKSVPKRESSKKDLFMKFVSKKLFINYKVFNSENPGVMNSSTFFHYTHYNLEKEQYIYSHKKPSFYLKKVVQEIYDQVFELKVFEYEKIAQKCTICSEDIIRQFLSEAVSIGLLKKNDTEYCLMKVEKKSKGPNTSSKKHIFTEFTLKSFFVNYTIFNKKNPNVLNKNVFNMYMHDYFKKEEYVCSHTKPVFYVKKLVQEIYMKVFELKVFNYEEIAQECIKYSENIIKQFLDEAVDVGLLEINGEKYCYTKQQVVKNLNRNKMIKEKKEKVIEFFEQNFFLNYHQFKKIYGEDFFSNDLHYIQAIKQYINVNGYYKYSSNPIKYIKGSVKDLYDSMVSLKMFNKADLSKTYTNHSKNVIEKFLDEAVDEGILEQNGEQYCYTKQSRKNLNKDGIIKRKKEKVIEFFEQNFFLNYHHFKKIYGKDFFSNDSYYALVIRQYIDLGGCYKYSSKPLKYIKNSVKDLYDNMILLRTFDKATLIAVCTNHSKNVVVKFLDEALKSGELTYQDGKYWYKKPIKTVRTKKDTKNINKNVFTFVNIVEDNIVKTFGSNNSREIAKYILGKNYFSEEEVLDRFGSTMLYDCKNVIAVLFGKNFITRIKSDTYMKTTVYEELCKKLEKQLKVSGEIRDINIPNLEPEVIDTVINEFDTIIQIVKGKVQSNEELYTRLNYIPRRYIEYVLSK